MAEASIDRAPSNDAKTQAEPLATGTSMLPPNHSTIPAVVLCALAALIVGIGPSAAEQLVPVELELVLAVDASGSVDAGEFDLQVRGLATAFRDPDVVAAIRGVGPAGIAVALMQWSGPGHQLVVVDWTSVSDTRSAAHLADRIEAAGRQIHGETSITRALGFSMQLFATNGFDGRRKVIDVSGDGPNNFGTPPDPMRDLAAAAGITVNGLAILNERPDLDRYYRDHVIGGPGAFLLTAADYQDFATAIRLKLIQDIRGAPFALDMPARTRQVEWGRESKPKQSALTGKAQTVKENL